MAEKHRKPGGLRKEKSLSRINTYLSKDRHSHHDSQYRDVEREHKPRKSNTFVYVPKVKPAQEIYQPPGKRSDGSENDNDNDSYDGRPAVGLQHSKSTGHMLHKSIETQIKRSSLKSAKPKQQQQPILKHTTPLQPGGLKRSKSLGSADVKRTHVVEDLGTFTTDVYKLIKKASSDPNRLSSRQLMETVKYILERALETTRYAEPAAKFCIGVIENEDNTTFLETLLNTCQEWYIDGDRLKSTQNHSKLPAFMSFLNEMYSQLKRKLPVSSKQWHNNELRPCTVLMTVICECCHICLKSQPTRNAAEIECLFFVLSSIGRDLENEMPGRMITMMNSIRDCFLNPALPNSAHKTLLQLIELHGAKWQLPAQAVCYYYPSAHH